ncbi:MAG: hypothetical protein ACKOWN_04580 [Microbacteriaceae bacterium]
MTEKKNPEEIPAPDGTSPQEVTVHDGESVSISVPTDGATHVTVNMIPPARSTGFLSSCLQGCGCLVVVVVVLGLLGSLVR